MKRASSPFLLLIAPYGGSTKCRSSPHRFVCLNTRAGQCCEHPEKTQEASLQPVPHSLAWADPSEVSGSSVKLHVTLFSFPLSILSSKYQRSLRSDKGKLPVVVVCLRGAAARRARLTNELLKMRPLLATLIDFSWPFACRLNNLALLIFKACKGRQAISRIALRLCPCVTKTYSLRWHLSDIYFAD